MAQQPTPVFLPGESPWTEEPDRLQSMGLHRVGKWLSMHAYLRWLLLQATTVTPEVAYVKKKKKTERDRRGTQESSGTLSPGLKSNNIQWGCNLDGFVSGWLEHMHLTTIWTRPVQMHPMWARRSFQVWKQQLLVPRYTTARHHCTLLPCPTHKLHRLHRSQPQMSWLWQEQSKGTAYWRNPDTQSTVSGGVTVYSRTQPRALKCLHSLRCSHVS